VTGAASGAVPSAAARLRASFLAAFSARRSRNRRSRLSFDIVVFLLALAPMAVRPRS